MALGAERWLLPLSVVLAHLALALLLTLVLLPLAPRRPRLFRLASLAAPLLVLAGIWLPGMGVPALPSPRPADTPSAGPDIVVLTLDTFRADHMGALGGGELTPHLDAIAAQGALFTQAVTTVPLTAPAHASMWTGLNATDHGLRANGGLLRADTVVPSVAAAGWRTGAFLSSHVLDRETGLAQGFQHYDDRWGWGQRMLWIPAVRALDPKRRPIARSGDEVVDRALDWLASGEEPALAWIHLYDTHAPYRPPRAFWPPEEELTQARRADKERHRQAKGSHGLIDLLDHGRAATNTLMYAAEVRWVDHLVGRVAQAIDPQAVLIVLADHGESLTEHGYYFNHGARLWEPSMQVPFLVRWPGRFEPGQRIDELVCVSDVAALVLAAAGLEGGALPQGRKSIEQSSTGQQARQMGAFLRRGERPRRPDGTKQSAALRFDGGKLLSHEGEAVRWFDLQADPGELSPQEVPEALSAQAGRVQELLQLSPPELDPDQVERLRALGYQD